MSHNKYKSFNDLKKELPTFLGFSKEVRKKYVNPLLKDPESPFHSSISRAPQKDILLNAAAIGFNDGIRIPLLGETDKNIRNAVFDNQDFSIMLSMAINEMDLTVVNDIKKVADIVEEYANGGIQKLYRIIMEFDGYKFSNIQEMYHSKFKIESEENQEE